MTDQAEKALAFRRLHERPGAFIIPNPWDVGTAKLLTQMEFEALATTSAGLAFALGRSDGEDAVNRAETLANARAIVEATPLPVNADLENGFGDRPEDCAETIRQAAQAGLVGGSIEDTTGDPDDPIYAFDFSVERVRAAVAAAHAVHFPFMLTARAENLISGRPDLPDTIRRLKAFAAAGADVLYAPGLKTRDEIAAVVQAVAPKPVNAIMGLAGANFSRADLAALGVKRISVGSALSRAAFGGFLRAAEEMRRHGTFDFAEAAVPYPELNRRLKQRAT